MKPRSLHLRLMAGAMVAIFAALVVAWLAMTWLFERHVERREALDLTRNAMTLVAGLRLGPDQAPIADQKPGDRHFEEPAGGYYWQISSGDHLLRSRSLWDQALPAPERPPGGEAWRTRAGRGPFAKRLLFVERAIQPDLPGPTVLVQVAADMKEVVAARREFGRELALFLVGLWAVLSAAALAQVRLGLRPLTSLSDDLARLRRSPSARLAGDHPRETAPLVEAINALAETREADLERARRRAADLAHSLKTPLSALSAQSRRARDAGAADAADGLDRAIAAVGAALEAELARARAAAARNASRDARAAPALIVERLIDVIERTDQGAQVAFETEIPADLRLPAPEDTATEILGALIENAARFARRRVLIRGEAVDGEVILTVDDDGAGIDGGRAEAALIRGGRLDEAGPGHGLGLAIVRDLVEATEGEIRLGRSAQGGLQVRLVWPARN